MRELRRQSFAREHLLEQLHVAARSAQPALERRAAAAGEELDVAVDVRVELETHVLDRGRREHLGIGGVLRGGGLLQVVLRRVTHARQPAAQVLQIATPARIQIAGQDRLDLHQRMVRNANRLVEITHLALRPRCLIGSLGLVGHTLGREGIGGSPSHRRRRLRGGHGGDGHFRNRGGNRLR